LPNVTTLSLGAFHTSAIAVDGTVFSAGALASAATWAPPGRLAQVVYTLSPRKRRAALWFAGYAETRCVGVWGVVCLLEPLAFSPKEKNTKKKQTLGTHPSVTRNQGQNGNGQSTVPVVAGSPTAVKAGNFHTVAIYRPLPTAANVVVRHQRGHRAGGRRAGPSRAATPCR